MGKRAKILGGIFDFGFDLFLDAKSIRIVKRLPGYVQGDLKLLALF